MRLRGIWETYMSCRLQTAQSTRDPLCTSSPSLQCISAYSQSQLCNVFDIHAADTENSRCFCCTCCHLWHAKGAGLFAAAAVNWRAARTTEVLAAILFVLVEGYGRE